MKPGVHMECETPLTDDELSLALDGLAEETTMRHLAQCSACSARLAEMRRMDQVLQRRLRRFKCPSPQRLADFHAGMLDTDAAAAVQAHLEDCPRCQAELEMLIQFLDLDPEESVPANIIPFSTPKNVLRAMRVQTSGNLALKGLDDETKHDAQTGSARVFLESRAIPQGFLLTGQIVDNEVSWVGAIAEASQEGASQQVRILDEQCEFSFELTATTPINIYITAASGVTLAIENVTIQE